METSSQPEGRTMLRRGLVLGGFFLLLVAVAAVVLVQERTKRQQREQLMRQFIEAAPSASAGRRASEKGWVEFAILRAIPIDERSGSRFQTPIKTEPRTLPDGSVHEVQLTGWSHYSEALQSLEAEASAAGPAIPEAFEFRLITRRAIEILEAIHRLGPIDQLRIEAHAAHVLELPTIQRDLEALRAAMPEAEVLLNYPDTLGE